MILLLAALSGLAAEPADLLAERARAQLGEQRALVARHLALEALGYEPDHPLAGRILIEASLEGGLEPWVRGVSPAEGPQDEARAAIRAADGREAVARWRAVLASEPTAIDVAAALWEIDDAAPVRAERRRVLRTVRREAPRSTPTWRLRAREVLLAAGDSLALERLHAVMGEEALGLTPHEPWSGPMIDAMAHALARHEHPTLPPIQAGLRLALVAGLTDELERLGRGEVARRVWEDLLDAGPSREEWLAAFEAVIRLGGVEAARPRWSFPPRWQLPPDDLAGLDEAARRDRMVREAALAARMGEVVPEAAVDMAARGSLWWLEAAALADPAYLDLWAEALEREGWTEAALAARIMAGDPVDAPEGLVVAVRTQVTMARRAAAAHAAVSEPRGLALGARAPDAPGLEPVDDDVTVVAFWASWCGPCMAELEALDALAASFEAEGGVRFLAVSTDAHEADFQRVLRREGWKHIEARWSPAAGAAYDVRSLPFLVAIDRQWIVRSLHTGYSAGDAERLAEELRRLAR